VNLKFLLSSLILLVGCVSLADFDIPIGAAVFDEPTPTDTVTTLQEDAQLEVHFCPQENCSQLFMDFLGNDEKHCALYELNKPELIEFLNRENVQLVVDQDSEEDVIAMKNVVIDTGGGLMHNKFCVAGDRVFTGSMNPTVNDITKNNNNIVLLRSAEIAALYETEFQELWNHSRNRKSERNSFLIDGTPVSIYFCPEDDCAAKIISEIEKAQREIYFMTFSFTHDGITDAVLSRFEQNVTVKGVFETRQITEYEPYELFLSKGMDVRKDGNKNTMHHKLWIVDSLCVITGSMNPTKNGDERNDENLLIICDKDIAAQYLEEFWRVYNEAIAAAQTDDDKS